MNHSDELFQSVYEAMIGALSTPNPPFPVEDEFANGNPCDKLYKEIYDRKVLINDRLHQNEDDDLETIMSSFWDITEILCQKMFAYGIQQGQLDSVKE